MGFNDDTIRNNPMLMADHSQALLTFSAELDQLGQEAQHLLAGSHEFFQGEDGATQYHQIQMLIQQAIQDGKDVIARHGNVIDNVSGNMVGADQFVGQSFQGL